MFAVGRGPSRGLSALALALLAVSLARAAPADVDVAAAVRAVLGQGAEVAVGRLGAPDGFLGNPEVRIPLPRKLGRAEQVMRMAGLGEEVDEVVTTMNRAAEAAVPEARALLVEAIGQMTIEDARAILAGGDDAATRHFEQATREALTERFMPSIKAQTGKLGLAADYNRIAGAAAQLGWIGAEDANLERYVTRKALDGLYLTMAAEERAIRSDPAARASELLRAAFGPPGH